jgi:hypothetical protein
MMGGERSVRQETKNPGKHAVNRIFRDRVLFNDCGFQDRCNRPLCHPSWGGIVPPGRTAAKFERPDKEDVYSVAGALGYRSDIRNNLTRSRSQSTIAGEEALFAPVK